LKKTLYEKIQVILSWPSDWLTKDGNLSGTTIQFSLVITLEDYQGWYGTLKDFGKDILAKN
jgi:hypothetical protein